MATSSQYRFTFAPGRQKLMFRILVVVFGLSFLLGFGVGGRSCLSGKDKGQVLATLWDKPITPEDLRNAKVNTHLHLFLTTGREIQNTPDFQKKLEDMAWRRIVAMRWADHLGIRTGNKEVDEGIVAEFTDRSGKFDQAGFEGFIKRTLSGMNLDYPAFREYYREHMNLAKLQRVIGSAAWITPSEMGEQIARFTDVFTVDYALLPVDRFESKAQVAVADMKEYFDMHSAELKQPERRTARYVVFPFSNYLDKAEIADADVKEYYEGYQGEFSVTNYTVVTNVFTNSYDSSPSDTNEPARDTVSTVVYTNEVYDTLPLEAVSNRIHSMMVDAQAAELAGTAAMDFVLKLTPDRDGKVLSLEDAVKEAGTHIQVTPFFAADEEIPGLNVGLDFNSEAFDLVAGDPDRNVGNPVVGEDAVYVIALDKVKDAHIPEFEAVTNVIHRIVLSEKKAELVKAGADDAIRSLQKSMSGGKNFVAAAKDLKLAAVTNAPFSWFTAPTNLPAGDNFMQSVSKAQRGEFAEPIPETNGVILAYVESRIPAMAGGDRNFEMYLADTLRQKKSALLFQEWQLNLLEAHGLTNLVNQSEEVETNDIPGEASATEDDSSDEPLDSQAVTP